MSVTKQDLTVYLFPFKRCSNCVCSHQDYLLDCDQQKVAITAGKQLNHIEKRVQSIQQETDMCLNNVDDNKRRRPVYVGSQVKQKCEKRRSIAYK